MSPDEPLQPGSRAIRAGRAASGASMAPALWASSVWESASFDDAHRRATSLRADEFYGRYANPTVRSFEQAIAELEGGEDAMAFASGMGAIATTILALCSAGDHVVAAKQLYAGTLAFLQGPCRRFGIDLTLVDGTRPGALSTAVRAGHTTVVIVETPSNPRLELVDLDEVGSIVGPFTVVDSTFATPLGQQPLAHGVDLVVHSATKGIAGHNDATIGVVAGERDLVDAIWGYGVLHGAMASPFDALNALRGLRSMAVRTAHQAAAAQRLAEWLQQHPAVGRVHYPGLTSHPQHDLAKRQMRQFGTVLAFELTGGRESVRALLDRVALARRATSLGGPETLVCHPMTTTHASLTPEEQADVGVTEGLVRVSLGLEDVDDLIADLHQALAAS
ncbi:MAG TPA: PLP-dependent aspartate aminotransferase family protein [Ilumatobacter sp.]|nr:PLP-dependent aspartate aminotransferase family protein [Ilumatobacter sp.]